MSVSIKITSLRQLPLFLTVQFKVTVSATGKMQCVETSPIFQNECNKIVKNLSDDDCEKFKILETDEERIRFLYNFAKTVPIVLKNDGKSFEEAQQKKVEGNALFAKKEYEAALVAYNEGIVKCPQNDGKYLDKIRRASRLFICNSVIYFYSRWKRTAVDSRVESKRSFL